MPKTHTTDGKSPFVPAWQLTVMVIPCALAGAAALRYASTPGFKETVNVLTLVVVLLCLVDALVDRGWRQRFAIGFTLCALAHWMIQWSSMPYFLYGLGTNQLTHRSHQIIVTGYWADATTGDVLGYDRTVSPKLPSSTEVDDLGTPGFGGPSPTVQRPYKWVEHPDLSDYSSVASGIWTMLIGACGGAFSLYESRQRDDDV